METGSGDTEPLDASELAMLRELLDAALLVALRKPAACRLTIWLLRMAIDDMPVPKHPVRHDMVAAI